MLPLTHALRGRFHCTFALLAFLLIAIAAGCGGGGGKGIIPGPPGSTPTPTPNTHVLVVANSNIIQSTQLAQTYMNGRHIPAANLVSVALTSDPSVYSLTQSDLQTKLFTPVANAIKALHNAGTRIDFVVLVYGVPYLVNNGTFSGYSVDGILTQATGTFPAFGGLGNPYYFSSSAFSSDVYHMVLVTRLDGRSTTDVTGLITQGLAADGTRPHGEFFFDLDPDRTGAYDTFNQAMKLAAQNLAAAGFDSQFDDTTTFVNPGHPLEGYASWGSNDYHYSAAVYHALTFVAGGIAETAVSTSASNIRTPGGGQSQIADLIHQGVTGVHGDVTEPFLSAIPDPPTVFGAYTSGRTLAESFYAGLSIIVWKEIVIGDPLCRPY